MTHSCMIYTLYVLYKYIAFIRICYFIPTTHISIAEQLHETPFIVQGDFSYVLILLLFFFAGKTI